MLLELENELDNLLLKWQRKGNPFNRILGGTFTFNLRPFLDTSRLIEDKFPDGAEFGIVSFPKNFLNLKDTKLETFDTTILLKTTTTMGMEYELRLYDATGSMAHCYYTEYNWGSRQSLRKITLIEYLDKGRSPDVYFHFKNGSLPFVKIEMSDVEVAKDLIRFVRLNHELNMLALSEITV